MIPFEICFLGTGSALPTLFRNPTSQCITINNELFLVDCGEGTQIQLRKNKIRFSKIENIFISHLHGDHFFGLPGLISSFHLLGRTKKLRIYCPPGLEALTQHIHEVSDTHLRFPTEFITLRTDKPEEIYTSANCRVFSVPLKHRIPCCGFVFEEKQRPGNLIPEVLKKHKVPRSRIQAIKSGQDFETSDGTVVPNTEFMLPGPKPRKYSFISDTAPSKKYQDIIRDSDLLYHEATFPEEMAERASETYHTTAKQAAEIARANGVSKLAIGHFSARFKDVDLLEQEARAIFPETKAIADGDRISIEIR
jgi:ribonuclease Z